MLDAAVKALEQLLSPPFRAVLLKSMGLALVLLIAIGVGLHRLIAWLIAGGGGWLETALGPNAHGPLNALEWVLSILAGFGLIAGAVFLMPAVTSLVAGLYADEIADRVERAYYPHAAPGT
ncbi:MAG TPA: EI24 domain-containing protein, partial [Xanthobacteraceae bacterium]|nr:EI24 domain-containing protein [Xanthobacteraceae bacterium]